MVQRLTILLQLYVKTNQDEKIMIVSGDKDFIQLQKYPNVKQYSHQYSKKYVNG